MGNQKKEVADSKSTAKATKDSLENKVDSTPKVEDSKSKEGVIINKITEVPEEAPKKSAKSPNDIAKEQKAADKKVADKNDKRIKELNKIVKGSVYAKVFAPGTFPGNGIISERSLAREAGEHLLVENKWTVESKVLSDGSTVQFIK